MFSVHTIVFELFRLPLILRPCLSPRMFEFDIDRDYMALVTSASSTLRWGQFRLAPALCGPTHPRWRSRPRNTPALQATFSRSTLTHVIGVFKFIYSEERFQKFPFSVTEKPFLPPQGFGPEAKTRGGTLGLPGCIHTRTKNIF